MKHEVHECWYKVRGYQISSSEGVASAHLNSYLSLGSGMEYWFIPPL